MMATALEQRTVMRASIAGIALVLAARPSIAGAHGGATAAEHDLWRAWSLDPTVAVGLLLAGWLYLRGVAALWRRAGRGQGIRRVQVASFTSGLVAVTIALLTPLDALSGEIFSAHMSQHVLLMLIAAPLLVIGSPLIPFLWALPQPWRRSVARWQRRPGLRFTHHVLTHPAAVWMLYVATLWLWHYPGLYEAALRSEFVHAAEHGALLGTSLLFWWVVIQPSGRRRLGYGAGILFTFAAAMQGMALGLLITLSETPWYASYEASSPAWGIDPMFDQQLAGSIMWTPGGMVYLATALILLGAWLKLSDRNAARFQHSAPPVSAP